MSIPGVRVPHNPLRFKSKGRPVLFISPWAIDDSDLEALGYDYLVGKGQK
jgi:hypothetical protein